MAEGSLPTLKTGEFRTILSVNEGWLATKRLADMGFVRGVGITMIRPGEPCMVRIDGRCVGLGAGYQESIRLSPE